VDGDVASRKKKGKCIEGEDNLAYDKQSEASQENCLATLDIFAGCGGLSEGLRQSGNPNLVLLLLFFFFLFQMLYLRI
jgi:DNA (cytosine-5)-methyltransferase 1